MQVSPTDLEKKIDVLKEVSAHSSLFLQREKHPLKGLKSGGMDQMSLERLEVNFNKLISFCDQVGSITKELASFFPDIDLRVSDLIASLNFFTSVATIEHLPDDWYKKTNEEYSSTIKAATECQDIFKEKQKLMDEFHASTSKSPSEIISIFQTFRDKYPSWYHKINGQYFKDKRKCKEALDKSNRFSVALLEELSNKGKKLLELTKTLDEKAHRFALASEVSIAEKIDALSEIKHQHEIAGVVKSWLQETEVHLAENPTFGEVESNSFAKLADLIRIQQQQVEDILKNIVSYWPEGLHGQTKLENIPTSQVAVISRAVVGNLNYANVRDWQTIGKLVNICIENDLLSFLERLDTKNLSIAPQIFEKRFYFLWIDAVVHSKEVLSEFSETSHEELIKKFKSLDEKLLRLTTINTIAEPAKIARQVKIAHSGFGNMNGVGILRKEMEKRKRLKPLRVLFNEIPQVLQALKPCFLMSPLSVSTFLKPGSFNFDVVIFDEASQLPTPEAIPSILRAKQVIVAGDSNQLPPTSFFRSNLINDAGEWEEDQIEELESLLDDCKAAVPYFQETDLKWHYRSRDERLINFSNHYYYENRLITFPAPNTDKSGVVLEYVPDGVWDRGGSRVNRKEARHVAKLIIKHFEDEPQKSLGVVALNSSQKEAIEEALDEELIEHKDLAPLMDSEKPEPFFVKSLENVQGDERDVIMISVGYGKASDGTMSMNFGPINTAGGWRRLNVLVTRAKWKTVLVTSIRSSELSGINPENKGPMGLKSYIQYAETGFLNESKSPSKILHEETNDFEDSVKRELELAGFSVDAQVGAGSFRIDLAVRDSKNHYCYALGIECDGASYHSSRSARDRDILRQEILQNMGWKIYRIWSTEWFRNRDEAKRLLIENVTRAVNGKEDAVSTVSEQSNTESDTEVYTDDTNLVTVSPRHKTAGMPYLKSQAKCNRDIVMKEIKKYQFVNLLVSIVHDEGPIHIDLLAERVKELAKVSRAGANIQKNFDNALKLAIKNGYLEKSKEDKGFIYEVGRYHQSFKVNGDEVQRRLSQISAEEIRNAVKYLIQEQFGLAYDNLLQSIKPLFGIVRADPEEGDRVKDIVDDMVVKGKVVRQGPLLNLASQAVAI
jgi:very-short-patch-repair endonuclease